MKRFLSAVLTAALLLCTLPAAFAASDIDGHWAKTYITALHELGIVNPSASDGNYEPDEAITRAEFMRYINRAMGFTETTAISYTDVASTDWYYETVQIAVKHGYINGVGNNRMSPDGTLTREQAATIIGRLHKLTPEGSVSTLSFSDKNSISEYAVPYITEAVDKGYIDGYTDGSFKPQATLTRGQTAKILYFFMGSQLGSTVTGHTASSLTDGVKNVTMVTDGSLTGATVSGDLYVTEGVGTGAVTLKNVEIAGDLIVAAGTVTLDGISAKRMVVDNSMGYTPEILCTGNTNIGETVVQCSASLRESSLASTAGGLSDLTLDGENLALTLDAQVWDVTVKQQAAILTTGSADINVLTASAKTQVTGGGTVQKAIIAASGCSLSMAPKSYELASGVTAELAGDSVTASTSVTVSPTTLSVDLSNTDALAHSYDFTFNADKNDLSRITVDGTSLKLGTDYNLLSTENGIRLYKTYLTSLKAGVYSLELYFDSGEKGVIGVTAINSAIGAISPSAITFDKYENAAGYADQSVTVALPSGTRLDSIKISSTVLERGADYTYDTANGLVTFLRESLANRSAGSYTVTFVPNKGSSLTCSLTITDSAPINEVSPSTIDFDANTASDGFTDLAVTLRPAEDETLKYIRCGDETLREGWQYKVDGITVTLEKNAVASFATKGATYADFTFVMSSGKSPVLRVNYVTTYALTAQVSDDLDSPIRGAVVTFMPSDNETGTATQTLSTDSTGTAVAYVKRGTYTVTVAHSDFTEELSQKVTVSGARTVKFAGEILENVTIVVTNSYGAPLSGATVTIGGQSQTTGADGAAVFSVKRASYPVIVSCSGYTTKTTTILVSDTIRERVMLD